MRRGSLAGSARTRSLAAIPGGIAVLTLAAACGGSSGTPPVTPEGNSSGNGPTITIQSFAYSPLTVAPGTKVTVRNDDSVAHTVTADSGTGFNTDVEGGATASFTAPATAGTYKFHCSFHPQMHGTLVVKS